MSCSSTLSWTLHFPLHRSCLPRLCAAAGPRDSISRRPCSLALLWHWQGQLTKMRTLRPGYSLHHLVLAAFLYHRLQIPSLSFLYSIFSLPSGHLPSRCSFRLRTCNGPPLSLPMPGACLALVFVNNLLIKIPSITQLEGSISYLFGSCLLSSSKN